MISDEIISVVCDAGYLYTRGGFTGDDSPRWYTQTRATRSGQFGEQYGDLEQEVLQPELNVDLYQKLIEELYKSMSVQCNNYSLLLANNFSGKNDLSKITERIFESLKVPNFFTVRNAVLSTFSAGRPSALVLDVGAFKSTAVAVHEGFSLVKTLTTADIGGESLNQYFKAYLPQKTSNYKYNNQLRDIKESFLNYETTPNPYELPDGTQITLQPTEITQLGERFFSAQDKFKGLQHLLNDVLTNTQPDIKGTLAGTVLVTGGTTAAPGFLNKVNTTFSAVAPPMCKVKLIQYPSQQNRQHSVFIGGSILASLSSFQSMWIGKQEYQEMGASILDRKCPM